MARSIEAALAGRGIDHGEADSVVRAFRLAMEPRIEALTDDHHPAYLHPGRSILVLLHDVEALESGGLVLAALHESEDDALRADRAIVADALGAVVAERLAELPIPGADRLEESLVLLPAGSAQAVLAERLDQLRHLHLRPEWADRWPGIHAEVERAWRPLAARVDDRLAVRYAHWSRTFEKRLRRLERVDDTDRGGDAAPAGGAPRDGSPSRG